MPSPLQKADEVAGSRYGVRFCDSAVKISTPEHCLPRLRETGQVLSDFLLGGKSHATCLMRSTVEGVARIVSIIERKIFAPSALPRCASEARSGCGIKPKTFRARLQIPAMLWIEPFGFASGTTWPWLSA